MKSMWADCPVAAVHEIRFVAKQPVRRSALFDPLPMFPLKILPALWLQFTLIKKKNRRAIMILSRVISLRSRA